MVSVALVALAVQLVTIPVIIYRVLAVLLVPVAVVVEDMPQLL
jgi:hypothetical protein